MTTTFGSTPCYTLHNLRGTGSNRRHDDHDEEVVALVVDIETSNCVLSDGNRPVLDSEEGVNGCPSNAESWGASRQFYISGGVGNDGDECWREAISAVATSVAVAFCRAARPCMHARAHARVVRGGMPLFGHKKSVWWHTPFGHKDV